MLLIQEMNVKPGGMFSRCVEDYYTQKGIQKSCVYSWSVCIVYRSKARKDNYAGSSYVEDTKYKIIINLVDLLIKIIIMEPMF